MGIFWTSRKSMARKQRSEDSIFYLLAAVVGGVMLLIAVLL